MDLKALFAQSDAVGDRYLGDEEIADRKRTIAAVRDEIPQWLHEAIAADADAEADAQ